MMTVCISMTADHVLAYYIRGDCMHCSLSSYPTVSVALPHGQFRNFVQNNLVCESRFGVGLNRFPKLRILMWDTHSGI